MGVYCSATTFWHFFKINFLTFLQKLSFWLIRIVTKAMQNYMNYYCVRTSKFKEWVQSLKVHSHLASIKINICICVCIKLLTLCLSEHWHWRREWVQNPFFAFAFCYHCFYYFQKRKRRCSRLVWMDLKLIRTCSIVVSNVINEQQVCLSV